MSVRNTKVLTRFFSIILVAGMNIFSIINETEG